MRDPGTLFKEFRGDRFRAAGYLNLARTLLGRLRSLLGPGISGAKNWVLRDGTVIRTVAAFDGSSKVIIDSPLLTKEVPCKPLPVAPLTGLAFMQSSTGETTSSRRIVLQPTKNFNPEKYTLWFFTPANRFNSELKAKFYETRKREDTCGNFEVEEWYNAQVVYGNNDWRGKKGVVLSWNGLWGRYFDVPFQNGSASLDGRIYSNIRTGGGLQIWGSARIFFRGKAIKNLSGQDLVFGYRVGGAALFRVPGKVFLIVVVTENQPTTNVEEKVKAYEVISMDDTNLVVSTSATTLLTTTWKPPSMTSWFFNESGTQAVANRVHNDSGTDKLKRTFLDIGYTGEVVTASLVVVGVETFVTRDFIVDASHTPFSVTTGLARDVGTWEDNCGDPPDDPVPFSSEEVVRTSASASGEEEILITLVYKVADYVGDELVEGVLSLSYSRVGSVVYNESINYTAHGYSWEGISGGPFSGTCNNRTGTIDLQTRHERVIRGALTRDFLATFKIDDEEIYNRSFNSGGSGNTNALSGNKEFQSCVHRHDTQYDVSDPPITVSSTSISHVTSVEIDEHKNITEFKISACDLRDGVFSAEVPITTRTATTITNSGSNLVGSRDVTLADEHVVQRHLEELVSGVVVRSTQTDTNFGAASPIVPDGVAAGISATLGVTNNVTTSFDINFYTTRPALYVPGFFSNDMPLIQLANGGYRGLSTDQAGVLLLDLPIGFYGNGTDWVARGRPSIHYIDGADTVSELTGCPNSVVRLHPIGVL